MKKQKIACDNQVPFWAIQILFRKGFDVVYRAKDQKDEVWFQEAIAVGAEVFVSPDSDIKRLCLRHGKRFLRLDQGVKGTDIAYYIVRKLAA